MKANNSFERLGLLSQEILAEKNTLSLHWIPYCNVLVLAFGLLLLSSKWLCPPGIQLQLPTATTSVALQTPHPLNHAIIVDARGFIFFERKVYDFEHLEDLFSNPIETEEVLWLIIDKSIAWEKVLKLFEHAHFRGYKSVQLAVATQ